MIEELDEDEPDGIVGGAEREDVLEEDDGLPEELVVGGLDPQVPQQVARQQSVPVARWDLRGGQVSDQRQAGVKQLAQGLGQLAPRLERGRRVVGAHQTLHLVPGHVLLHVVHLRLRSDTEN